MLDTATPLPGAVKSWHTYVDAPHWLAQCRNVRDGGGRLVALWGSDERKHDAGFAVHCALATRDDLLWLTLPLAAQPPCYPDLSGIFPAAARMQRALFDLLGVQAADAVDQRKWLRHAAWPEDQFPLRKDFTPSIPTQAAGDDYQFVRVSGDGVHEIPVGPVHAGTIEPGHFRFSVVGERVLRLEERLGYTHKGIEKRFEALSLTQGAKLAGRISGDSTVAYAWAYAMAVESVTGCVVPPRALWLRALFLERERIANHLGDLGYLGNDAALSFGFAQFWILKEQMLHMNHTLFGHRYLMDCVLPGGVAADVNTVERGAQLSRELDALEQTVNTLHAIYDQHAGVQDRFLTTGNVTAVLAAQLGLAGLAGRASAQAWDLRVQLPCAPYHELDVRMATHANGDVAARVSVRFEEIIESLRLIRQILTLIPEGPVCGELPSAAARALGVGWIEAWRGEVLVALHTDDSGGIARLHAHDPSWQNWPLLEHAVMGNIVPDFPLINKSFNLSYSGHDL